MSLKFRNNLGFWFFMLAGMVGITMQLVKYFNNDLTFDYTQGLLTVVFSVFILKPRILISLFEDIKELLTKKAK